MNRRQAGFTLVAAASLAMALGLGGAHPYWLLSVTPFALFGALLVLWRRKVSDIPLPVAITFALAAYSGIQAIPLPLSVVKYLSPEAAETWSRALFPFNEVVAWGSLSLDRGASVREALKWFLYATVLWTAIRATHDEGPRAVALVVFGSAFVVAVCTLAHGLTGAQRVFGVYEPTFEPTRWQIGPLLNPNNLSGYLNLGAFVGVGLAFSERSRDYRWLILTGIAVLLGVSMLSGSRAGILLMPLGLGAFVLARRSNAKAHRPDSASTRAELMTVLFGAGAAVCFALLGASTATWASLSDTSLDKLRLATFVWPMFTDFPFFGVGRGAFESTFPAYAKAGDADGVYPSPENFLLHWLSEWGGPVTIAAAIAYGWSFWPRFGRLRERVRIGALAGITLLLLQNLLDLGLEVPGVVMLLCWALALIWVPREPQNAVIRRRSRRRRSLPRLPLVLATTGTCLWVTTLYFARMPLSAERSRLRDAAVAAEGKEDVAQLRAGLRTAMLRHPAEPYFPRLGGLLAVASAHQDSMRWVTRAIERAPTDPRTHILAAKALARHAILAQAMFELRYAVELDPDAATTAGRLAAQWASNWDELRHAIPKGSAGGAMLLEAGRQISREEQGEFRMRVLREAFLRDRRSLPIRRALVSELTWQLANGKCANIARCTEEAVTHTKVLEREAPESASSVILHAGVLAAIDRPAEAAAVFASRCKTITGVEQLSCLRQHVRLLRSDTTKPAAAALRVVADEFARSACAVRTDCTAELIEAGDALASASAWQDALSYYQRAAQSRPGFHIFMRLAKAAGHLQRFALAEASLQRAERYAGNDARLRARIENTRRQARSSASVHRQK